MFSKIFNITPPQVEPVQVLVKQAPTIKRKASKPSVKVDALKTMEKVLDALQNVNNVKVNSLRKLYFAIENGGDLEKVIAFYKEPVTKKKEKKFISGQFY